VINIKISLFKFFYKILVKSNHERWALNPEKKFTGLSWETKETGAPILKDCMAWFELQVKERHDTGKHTLFIGEVINSGVNTKGTPLCTLEYDEMYIGKQ
jgi:flavin reductase (DIM6/NTAB) family NADH-FMN oxidoreductase RutF